MFCVGTKNSFLVDDVICTSVQCIVLTKACACAGSTVLTARGGGFPGKVLKHRLRCTVRKQQMVRKEDPDKSKHSIESVHMSFPSW